MFFLENIRSALDAIWSNKLRSGLTMLGIMIGVASVVLMVAIGRGGQKQVTERKELDTKLLAQNIAALADARLVIKAKANEKGHLYDAVGESEISAAAKEQAKVDLPVEAIKIDRPFKELGTFDIPVAAGETFGTFSITIEAE